MRFRRCNLVCVCQSCHCFGACLASYLFSSVLAPFTVCALSWLCQHFSPYRIRSAPSASPIHCIRPNITNGHASKRLNNQFVPSTRITSTVLQKGRDLQITVLKTPFNLNATISPSAHTI